MQAEGPVYPLPASLPHLSSRATSQDSRSDSLMASTPLAKSPIGHGGLPLIAGLLCPLLWDPVINVILPC